MPQVIIDNPILNSPYKEPNRHFKFDKDGITNEVVEERRRSQYFIPIAKPHVKNAGQMAFETEWTEDRLEEIRLVNDIRKRLAIWRKGGWQGITTATRELLEYWTNPEREKPLFFCQIEALETLIYLTEVASSYDGQDLAQKLVEANNTSNPGLPRIAFKMATGVGKTVVMAMMIAWHTLNKLANPQNALFTDTFLVVTPGITIRDRLRVLLPNDPQNYYRQRDIVAAQGLERLQAARIVITNFHALALREKISAGKLTKAILAQGQPGIFSETPDQMVRRVCRDLGNKRNILVINDEAHHCYRRKPDGEAEKLKGEERAEAKKRDEEARVWISGLESIQAKIGVRAIYDLSATPFFLRGSGYPEGTLFPWVVADFALIDAIESGIVKVPRVPVSDNTMDDNLPTYRNIWMRIRDELPRKGRGTEAIKGEPKPPLILQGALHSLYSNYEKYYQDWEKNEDARARGLTAPVFIVVCSNTNVSKMVYDWIAGWEKQLSEDVTRVQTGQLAIFRNDDGNGGWLSRPNTILVDSEQLESGQAMSDEFKQIASLEIEEFKAEYRQRFPGRDTANLTDEDLLREVMNTVGKPGKLGEHVKCVVSVSMLTEGWDANTVTHVLGVRAFGTQLLCEQVVGRALRRSSYAVGEDGMFTPQYAEVFGVPFSFIPCGGTQINPTPGPIPTRVRALEERSACEITFPRLAGYRYDIPGEELQATFNQDSRMTVSTMDIPTETVSAPIVGESVIMTLDDLQRRREQEVAFRLAKLTLERYFTSADGDFRPWLFPQLLQITKRWMAECVYYMDHTYPQLLLLSQLAHNAADHIYRSIVTASAGQPVLKPVLRPYDTLGSSRYVDFDTIKPVMDTRADKCQVSHVVADSGWEHKIAATLEGMPEVRRYVKNQHLDFSIPYTIDGNERAYIPDFIACIDDGRGPDDLLQLILEVTGEVKKDKEAKTAAARSLWVPAVNNHGGYGRWGFLEIRDPWDAEHIISAHLRRQNELGPI